MDSVRELDHPPREPNAGESRHAGEQQTLGEQLLHESRALRAEAESDRHLTGAVARARKKEIGHVHARDEQQHADDGHHDRRERDLRALERGMYARLRLQHDVDLALLVVLRMLGPKARDQALSFARSPGPASLRA